MRRNLAIVIAGSLLPMCFIALAQQRRVAGLYPSNPPLDERDEEKRILAVLDRMVKSHETYLSVPIQDGKALRLLTEATDAKNVVEIGTSTGYSGLWLCLALQRTAGHLTTFEIDQQRASMARQHFKEAGVEKVVTIIEGDAHEQVAKLKGPIDVAFIDADKSGYVDYLTKLLPLLQPGGLILAHNVEMVPDYVKAVTSRADLETIFYMEGGGLGVTLKKR
ncbi:MAG TPA: class I SAM-dependent methyltransferase [Terriglobales bacterium]|nr:class I SAM-dependent methyltransferase [Terriglobales bacterium]